VRHETITGIVRQLGVVLSRRVGQAVGLWGEPGIGKTYTAQQILREVPCQSLRLHVTAPEAAIARALPRPKKMPVWAETQLERAARGEHVETRAFVDALTATLAGLAPFVLHLEDLHEASPERLEMIVALARAVTHTKGVGLLVTSRSEPPEPFLNHRLDPLDDQETTVLLEREIGAGLPREGLGWIQARTMGNPLFALEFARYLTRQGFLWSDGKRWNWRAPPEGFVPVTIEALISQLVSGFAANPDVRTVLEARSILPRDVPDDTWMAVAAVEAASFDQARAALERGGIVLSGEFAHPLIAEVVRRELPVARRREYATRAMHVFEHIDPVLAAEYINDANLEPDEAVNRLEEAARNLLQTGDLHRVAQLLARAAERSSGERQGRLALEAARLFLDRDVPECERLARLALSVPSLRQDATFVCVAALLRGGRIKEAWQLLEALPESGRDGLEWWQTLVGIRSSSGRNHEVVGLWDEQPTFHSDASVACLYDVITALVDLGEMERANGLIDNALARTDFDARARARILNRRNAILYRETRYAEVERNLTEVLESLDENTYPWDCLAYYANRSNARSRLHKNLEARADAERACKLHLSTGALTGYANLLTKLSLAQIYLFEYEQAEQVLLEATSLAQYHDPKMLWDCYGHLSFLYLRWNPPHGVTLARRYAGLGLQEARKHERNDAIVSALEDCVRAEMYANAPEAALGYATELERIAQRTGLEEDLTASAFHLGHVHARLGNCEAAVPYLLRAAELYEAHGNTAEALNSGLLIDQLTGDVESAGRKLEWFEAHHFTFFAARVREFFPQLGLTSAPTVSNPIPSARIDVLGPIVLEHDDQPVPTRARKRLEILAYLLETRIAGRSEASALELVDALYPNAPEIEARNTLKQQVYLIRSSLGQDSITSTSNGYALGAVSSDAEEFLRTGDAGLWRGAYLSGLGAGWLVGVRDALTLALRSSTESLLGTDALEAARVGQILCELEPYDPDALRLAVHALEVAGDERLARQFYVDGCARLLEVGESLPAVLGDFLAVVRV
jgi:DNA-binding SARP family transcriptional activator